MRSRPGSCGEGWAGCSTRKIRGFYDAIDHGWLLRFLEHRIADRRVLRLIRKWLGAGVIEDGRWAECDEGTPQGAFDFDAASERVPALRLRPVGPSAEASEGARSHGRGGLR